MNNIPPHVVKSAVNLDSARTTTYMTEHEKDMILEINLIRSNPKGYIPFVKKYIQQQENKKAATGASWLQDSIDTAHELIAQLETTEPVQLLEPHEKLRGAAQAHGDEAKTTGNLTHTGANGSQPWDRIPAADPTLVNGGENIVKGVPVIRDAVITLLVDAGIPNRGHRKNILKPKWKYVACYEVGTVGDMPNNWLQMFAAPADAPTMNNSLFDDASNSMDLSDFGNIGGNAISTSITIEQAADGTVTKTTVANNSDGSTTTTIEITKPDGSSSTSISTSFSSTPISSGAPLTTSTAPSTTDAVPVAPKTPVAAAPTGDVSEADLDTARNEDYMTDREKDMIKEVNLIRSNPIGYIPVVEAYIQKRESEKSSVVGGGGWIDDDINTAKELIEELKTTPRLSILKPYKAIYTAAKLHGDEGKSKSDLGHQGSDGSWPWDRVLRQAPELTDGNENLVGGPADVATSVMLLLVDSGIPNRGHRKTTLNPSWTYCGFYEVGTVGDMPNYWVQKYGY